MIRLFVFFVFVWAVDVRSSLHPSSPSCSLGERVVHSPVDWQGVCKPIIQPEHPKIGPSASGSLFVGKCSAAIQVNKTPELRIDFRNVETSYTSGQR